MREYQKKYKAFTLIELMVVIAIIGVMTAIGFGILQNQKSSSALTNAQREVASAIKLAQTYALQGKTVNGTTPCGFGFAFDSNDLNRQKYFIFYIPAGSSDCATVNSSPKYVDTSSTPTFESYVLNNNIKLDGSTSIGNTEIYFSVPNGAVYDSTGNMYAGQTINFSDSSANQKSITINSGGSIMEN